MRITPEEARHRIAVTTSVRDTDAIPKVPDAGTCREQDGRRVQVMHNGVLIVEGCYHGPWMTEVIRDLRGHHEPQEELAFHAVVQRLKATCEAPVMVELGAFWAYYSVWAKHEIPALRCVMVEPDANNLDAGRRNFALNGMEGSFVHAAVGPAHGSSIWLETESDAVMRRVPLVSLEGLMRDEGLDRVDLVLCDIQGGELDVLRGARDLMRAGRLRFLVVSTHHHTISGDPQLHRRCLDELRAAGAHIIAEHPVAESCSGDGLIAASLDERDRDLHVEVTPLTAYPPLFGPDTRDTRPAAVLRRRVRGLAGTALRGARIARARLRER